MSTAPVMSAAGTQRHPHRAIALRALLALLVSAALAPLGHARLVAELMEPWRTAIEWLEPDFRVIALRHDDAAVEVELTLARSLIMGSQVVLPDRAARARAATPSGSVWLQLSLFLAVLAAWPWPARAIEMAARLICGAGLLGLLLWFDVPVMLLGTVRAGLVEQLDPTGWDVWAVAGSFLRSGGQALLAGSLAASACLAAGVIGRSKAPP